MSRPRLAPSSPAPAAAPAHSTDYSLRRSRRAHLLPLLTGLVVIVAFFIITGVVSYRNVRMLRQSSALVAHTHQVMAALEELFSLMRDGETGQRGYIITGNESYLDPYNDAIARLESRLAGLRGMMADNPVQQQRLAVLSRQIEVRVKELQDVLVIRRTQGFEPTRNHVLQGRGKAAMDNLRAQVKLMKDEEEALLKERFRETQEAFDIVVRTGLVGGGLGILLAVAAAGLVRRATLSRLRQQWVQTGQSRLAERLMGDQHITDLGGNALRFLSEYLNAQAGAVFVGEVGGTFERVATYAVPLNAGLTERFTSGQGLLGQAVLDRRTFVVNDVPEGYLTVSSGLGTARPRHLLVAPVLVDGIVNGVIELGFFQPVPEDTIELLNRTAGIIGVAVRSAKSRALIEELLEESQRQSEEVQAQAEELRVSNEELEEQSRALQKTQAQLEQQQTTLEQTNVQLEEQTQLLESQKAGLLRAKTELETQARVVEQASRYKTDFLANMSHELRTPLNSSLILAQLLSENREGNLTSEQIKYARTIQSSGNDLLALINDVLDLSKIEAGKMDLKPRRVQIGELLETLRAQFEPLAGRKGLNLQFVVLPGAPAEMETDPLRLEQVLRNLLSNALKFTESGGVTLEIASAGPDRVSLSVRDTGIGIDPGQQKIVFEPFCQADGTTNRKYGGTGLGLSISRELTRLLGGGISLESEPGRGSTFMVTLPVTLPPLPAAPAPAASRRPGPALRRPDEDRVPRPAKSGSLVAPPAPAAAPASGQAAGEPEMPVTPHVADDRARINSSQDRVILVVEDDRTFAGILVDLAREHDFLCLATPSSEEALDFARQYLPSAVLLDVGLPDGSGLFVLDRLKHDARTRHIPVHIISGNDVTEKALAMGAAGYMMKPVAREELSQALQALQDRLTHRLRRVLVVEDDPVQLSALCDLLASREVEAIGAQDAAQCLVQLQSGAIDCMVLDLSLPDATGFALLEQISADESYPFPPVIIYTGRELSAEEEQRLRRYSKSIIIKGAKSPERLLDEVALFLHQVVADLPAEQQKMIAKARSREAALEDRRVLLVEDDVRNIFALTSLLEPLGLVLEIARNGREALEALERTREPGKPGFDLVLMDIMMPEMDGLAAMRHIRRNPEWQKLPIIALTAKAMPSDQEQCLAAGASDYLSKPLDVEKLLSLVRVWMPR